ncbi:MAG TPA: AEC family transporter [Xanthobacteraceae bacterium]|nr:AEC family transporter [Xanthobacteraceae bacterium]
MQTILYALLPVFMLVALGIFLKRTLLKSENAWDSLEDLTYYILFPALLFLATATADLSKVPIWGVFTALVTAILVCSLLLIALRVPMQRVFGWSGPSFTSVFQGGVRWNTYIALGVASPLLGEQGLAIAAVALASMIPLINVVSVVVLARYAPNSPAKVMQVLVHLLRNPFIWACGVGILVNVIGFPIPKVVSAFLNVLGQASLPLGLMIVGAGLNLKTFHRINAAVLVSTVTKMLLLPVIAIGVGYLAGVGWPALAVIAIASSVPSAPNGYMLARQMGGDAPLLAHILTIQIFVALISIPVALIVATGLSLAK